MTDMDICILQKNDEMWCGSASYHVANLLAASLKPETGTIEDVFSSVKAQRYPWGFSWRSGKKMMSRDVKPEDYDFRQSAGLQLKYASPGDVFALAPEGNLFIDLQHGKLIHIDHRSPEGDPFPSVLSVSLIGDSVAFKKFDECNKKFKAEGREAEIWRSNSPCDKFVIKKRPAPAGFAASAIKLDYIPEGEQYSKSDEAAAKALLDDLRSCKNPSGEFFRSLGSCAGMRASVATIPAKPRQRRK